jgi:hypothetical protein
MAIQSPEIGRACTDLARELVEVSDGPIGITVGSTLNKVQAARAFAHERFRIFTREHDARQWLLVQGLSEPSRSLA